VIGSLNSQLPAHSQNLFITHESAKNINLDWETRSPTIPAWRLHDPQDIHIVVLAG
jgi:hypothetical protein